MVKRRRTYGVAGGSVQIIPAHDRTGAYQWSEKQQRQLGDRYSKTGIDKTSKQWRRRRKKRGRRNSKRGVVYGSQQQQ